MCLNVPSWIRTHIKGKLQRHLEVAWISMTNSTLWWLHLQYLFKERQVFEGLPHTTAKNHNFAMRAPSRSQRRAFCNILTVILVACYTYKIEKPVSSHIRLNHIFMRRHHILQWSREVASCWIRHGRQALNCILREKWFRIDWIQLYEQQGKTTFLCKKWKTKPAQGYNSYIKSSSIGTIFVNDGI